jgi:hypothetical protein
MMLKGTIQVILYLGETEQARTYVSVHTKYRVLTCSNRGRFPVDLFDACPRPPVVE